MRPAWRVARWPRCAASARPTATGLGLAPRTRLNASVTAQRAFASVSLPLAELKALRRAHDATLNDVVLMVCSGALRRYFLKHGPLPRKSLVAAVPVSMRAAGDTSSNNQASMTVVSLGTHIADPLKRLAHVMAATARDEGDHRQREEPAADRLSVARRAVADERGERAVRQRPRWPTACRRSPTWRSPTCRARPFPLYMAGAKMLTNYPTSIVVHGIALNITVQSYDESLDFGLIACARGDAARGRAGASHAGGVRGVRGAAADRCAKPPPRCRAGTAIGQARRSRRAQADARQAGDALSRRRQRS